MNVIYIYYIYIIYIYICIYIYIKFIFKSIKVLKILNVEANDVSILFSTNRNNSVTALYLNIKIDLTLILIGFFYLNK